MIVGIIIVYLIGFGFGYFYILEDGDDTKKEDAVLYGLKWPITLIAWFAKIVYDAKHNQPK